MKKRILFSFLLITSSVLFSQRSMNLEDCRKMAIQNNKTIKIAEENVRAAQALKKAALAHFLPNFSAIGNYTWNEKNVSLLGKDAHLPVGAIGKDGKFGIGTPTAPPTPNGDGTFSIAGLAINNKFIMVGTTPVPLDVNGKPFDPKKNPEKLMWKNYAMLPKDAMEFDMRNIFVGGISFVQPIFMGGKIIELNNIAKYNQQLAETRKDIEIENLIVNVDEAYWRVISVTNKVKLAQKYRNLVAQLDSNVTIMRREGVVTKADLLKIRVKLNEADVTLTKAQNGLNLSKMALNQLLGLPLNENIILADTDLEKSQEMIAKVELKDVFAHRPEIRMLSLAENIAESNKKIIFSRFLPNVLLTGNYLISNPNSFNGYEKKFDGMFTFNVTAQIPLFHFGEKIHTFKAARSTQTIAKWKLEEAKEKIELQINQKEYKVTESAKKQIATRKNIEVAEENLFYAQEGFKEGVITSTDLLMAQTAWLSAKSEYIDAVIELKLNNVYLKKSMGVLYNSNNK